MKKVLLLVLCSALWVNCKKAEPAEAGKPAEPTADAATPPQAEFADAKYTEIGKKYIEALASGDTDAMMSVYTDDAKYYWNSGDSLVGKKAIADFWVDRRKNVIETLSFKNDIWLPVKVNRPQSVEKTGVWLLSWYEVTAKYKGGKSMTQWMHILFHFDDNDKVDQVSQYVDRVPINEALPKK